MNGPAGNNILSLEVSKKAVYAGTELDGVFKSTNNGITWSRINNGLKENISGLSIYAKDSTIFLGTNYQGLFTSNNEGGEWKIDTSGLPKDLGVYSFLSIDSTVIIRPYRGLYISFDNGKTWSERNGNLPLDTLINYTQWQYDTIITPIHLNDLAIYNHELYAGTKSHGLLLSRDLGLTWSRLDSTNKINTNIISLFIEVDKIILATDIGFLVSVDRFQNWTTVSLGKDNVVSKIYKYGNYYYTLSYHGVFISSDGFSWDNTNPGLSYNYVTALAFTDDRIIAGTYRAGVYISSINELHWTPSNKGFSKPSVLTLAHFNNELYAGSENGFVYKYNDELDNWFIQNPDQNLFEIHKLFPQDNYLWAATNNGVYKYSIQNNWQKYSNGIPVPFECRSIIGKDSILFVGTWGQGVFISSDSGATWRSLNPSQNFIYVKSLALSNDELFAVLGSGDVNKYYRENGEWKFSKVYFPETMGTINVMCNGNGDIFAGDARGVMISSDNGTTWKIKNEGIMPNAITQLAITELHYYNNVVYVSTFSDLYFSKNNGDKWLPINTGIEPIQTEFIHDILTIDSTLYISTYDGVYQSNLKNVLTNVSKTSEPYQFILEQNYPNPFNPATTIQYQLPEVGDVRLIVYDMLGREVAILVDGIKEAGYYTSVFDGSKLSSGLYFYRISVGKFANVKKMMLVK
ncbi:MAG: T9SS type A sorting domain-containing protein [Bacteroidota bacterium]|nr:T9SS type A sorting domain-containing protein [Bacteroidota bacterium]